MDGKREFKPGLIMSLQLDIFFFSYLAWCYILERWTVFTSFLDGKIMRCGNGNHYETKALIPTLGMICELLQCLFHAFRTGYAQHTHVDNICSHALSSPVG